MSDYDDDDQQDQGPKALREAREKAAREATEQRERADKLEKQLRDLTLREVLKERDLNPKVVELIPADADPTQWLETYGELFGAKKSAPTRQQGEPTDDGPTADEVDQLRKQQDADAHGFRPGNEGDELQKLNNAESLDDLIKLVKAAQRGQ